MELLAGIVVLIAVFQANFLVGKYISNKPNEPNEPNEQIGLNNEVQIIKGVD